MTASTKTDPTPASKIPKTSWIFVALVVVTFSLAWMQFYAVPLEHVSTRERLQASKESFTNNGKQQIQQPKNAQSVTRGGDVSLRQSATGQQQRRPDYHVVFSTSCSEQQNWESYVFFYHAMRVQQPGNVTRIASACTAKEAKEQTDFFHHFIAPMNPGNFHLHLTPDYGKVALAHGHYYKYMNKRTYLLV